jgi:GMP synthase (glutamine-hydrolysing)
MQWIAHAEGGEVSGGDGREYGRATATVEPASELFHGLERKQTVWMSHGDSVTRPPEGFRVIASTGDLPIAGFEAPERRLYGIQFHPEVRHTEHGTAVLQNFLFRVCGVRPDWSMSSFREQKVADILREAPPGAGSVVCALSGGVDSSVTAILLREALGDRVHPILVDHGLMRAHEADQVVDAFATLGIRVHKVDASDLFLSRLEGVEDPEQKRKIIESVAIKGPSSVIKTHHNVGGLPEKLGLKLIEPVRELFKDEVRLLGAELGLPREFLARHPFPGPGLAVRIPGPVSREKVAILQRADEIVLDEIR